MYNVCVKVSSVKLHLSDSKKYHIEFPYGAEPEAQWIPLIKGIEMLLQDIYHPNHIKSYKNGKNVYKFSLLSCTSFLTDSFGIFLNGLQQEEINVSTQPALDPSDISSCRPVSLLVFLLKILPQDKLPDPNQSGFRVAHSLETALLAVTENLHVAKCPS